MYFYGKLLNCPPLCVSDCPNFRLHVPLKNLLSLAYLNIVLTMSVSAFAKINVL